MKRLGSLFLIIFLSLSTFAHAETFFGVSGSYVPEQSASATGIQGEAIFDLDNSYGANAEVGFYSPGGLLSFAVEAGFQNLTAFNPIPGSPIQSIDAGVFSVMGKMCAHAQNKTKVTPYACGGLGMFNIDPSATVGAGNGNKLDFDSVFASGYSGEAGLQYKCKSCHFSVFGAASWQNTFDNPTVSIAGIPASAQEVDIGRFSLKAGVRF